MFTKALTCFLLSAEIVCGQDTLADCKFSIKTAPLSLINIYDGPCYKIGAELKLYRNLSFYMEYGGYIPVEHSRWYYKLNIVGFQIRPEIKLYLNKEGRTSGRYVSVDYFYKDQNFDFWATITDSTSSTLKDYHIWKKVSSFNLKYGELLSRPGSPLIIEYFAGAGVWITNGKDNLTETERSNTESGEGQGGLGADAIRSTGQYAMPNITAGLKIGWKIK